MLIASHHWWSFVVRGLFAVIFGLLTFLVPGITLLSLLWIFGFFAILDGIVNIAAAFRPAGPTHDRWWGLLIQGILGLVAGVLAFALPGLTAVALVFLIAGWAIVTGVLAIIAAVRLRRHVPGEWLMILSGALSILFGVFAAVFPGAGALAIVFWIGAYAIAFGIILIILGFRVRAWLHGHGDQPSFPGSPNVAPL
jgi:uncharacterized membrane protein HdeD (DUF308 family)